MASGSCLKVIFLHEHIWSRPGALGPVEAMPSNQWGSRKSGWLGLLLVGVLVSNSWDCPLFFVRVLLSPAWTHIWLDQGLLEGEEVSQYHKKQCCGWMKN